MKTKAQLIQYNPRSKKFYYKYLRVKTKKGVSPVTAFNIDAPVKWLIEEYEALKEDFTKKLNKDIENQLNEQDNPSKRPKMTDLQETSIQLMAKYNNIDLVCNEMGLSPKTVYFHINQAKKKGYTLEEFGKKEVKLE